MSTTPSPGLSVVLFVRSQAPSAIRSQQQTVIEQLEQLRADGHIDEFDVHVWGTEICPDTAADGTTCHATTVHQLATFEAWAAQAEVSLARTFQRREYHSTITGDHYTSVITPLVCLAVFQAGEIQGVYPCDCEQTTYTVQTALDQLAIGKTDSSIDIHSTAT